MDQSKIIFYAAGQGMTSVAYDGRDTGIRISIDGKGRWRLCVRGVTQPGDHARIIHDTGALRTLVAPHIAEESTPNAE